MRRLEEILPPVWSRGNPVDIIGDAPAERYEGALDALLADRGNDAVLVLNCPTAIGATDEAADAVIRVAGRHRRPVLTSWLGETSAREARRRFGAARIPTYDTPTEAVRAFMHLVRYRHNQEMLKQVPPSIPDDFVPDMTSAELVIDRALADGRDQLTELEAKAILEAYAIPTVPTRRAETPDEAARAAEAFGGRCVIKILSPDITHKSDVGGVMLGLADPWRVYEATRTMLDNIRAARPEARIEGVSVQPMVDGSEAYEVIVGMLDDPLFGPVLLFGEGGTAVEVVRDQALTLPPLNLTLAWSTMQATRIFKLLEGYRDRPPVAIDALALTLVKVSQLVSDLDRVVELDVNPLLVDPRGVVALDGRIRVRPASRRGTARLAIRPYPKELEQGVEVAGRHFLFRPIRPEDAPALRRMVDERTTPEDKRLRFFSAFKTLSVDLCARLTQIDYDREMALVAVDPAVDPADAFCGAARIAADPDRLRAEYAILVRSDLKGQGLGTALMHAIIDHAKSQGIRELFGTVLRDNRAMLELAEHLGFERAATADPDVVDVCLSLEAAEGTERSPRENH